MTRIVLTRLVVASLAAAIPCRARTSVVVVRTSTEIIVAADSLVTNPSRPPEQACKITLLGRKRAFASAQLATYRVADFDAAELAVTATTPERTVRQVELAFRTLVKPKLIKSLTLREHAPAIFTRYATVVLETLFAGIDNGTPTLVVTFYLPVVSESGVISLKTEIRACSGACGSPIFMTFLGEFDEINSKYRPVVEAKTPVEAAHDLVQLEIDQSSETVGPPIGVLRLSNKGHDWPYPGVCQGETKNK